MRRSEAARYARWAAAVAVLLAAAVAGVYTYRAWQAAQVRREAPPAVPPTVHQRSAEFSFSKVEHERTLFTVRASRATEFKEGNKSLLEDVWITIYGRQGRRYDNIHTRECDYEPATGRILCAGDVQIDLESAEEARQRPGQRVIHVGTRNVSFHRDTGEARTDQPVVFRFPYGQGRGVGVTYSTRDATVRLHRDVEMTLTQRHPSRQPVVLTGSSLEYHRSDRTLRLLAPVRVKQGNRELTAGELALELDPDLHAHRVVARGKPQLRSVGARGQTILAAEEFAALLHPDGWAEQVWAAGSVRGSFQSAMGEDHLGAQRLDVEMEPARNQPGLLTASGDVKAQSERRGESKRLETAALRLFFVPGGRSGRRQIHHAESLSPATFEWNRAGETTRVRGERLGAEFGDQNRIRQLRGHSGVEMDRRIGNRPPQVTTSREFGMQFGAGGDWTEVNQSGNVRFREGDRTAQAERARLVRPADTSVLSGSAVVADGLTRTTAQTLAINQRTGEVRAEGGVRTSYVAAERNGITNLAPQPAHISSEQLLANRSSGRALYSGRARVWQGEAVIEADSIELVRDDRRVNARGNVMAVFPQAAEARGSTPGGRLWRVRAATLTYWSGEGRARLEGDVSARSALGEIRSRTLDLLLTSAEGGPRELTRAVASGGVTLEQGERRATAERAEYTVAEGKIVLSGRPTLYDARRGTTTGDQLTFFLANDKILVDSEEGSRTLTRHRFEK